MWKTILALLVTIIVIPVLAFTLDEPLTDVQRGILVKLLIVYLAAALLCFIVSTITGNYSQVDKMWSLIPIAYVWIVAVETGFESRLVLMAFLVSVWGLRLSYNFARKGGFSWKFWTGVEDYRWSILMEKPELKAKWRWMIFNLFFISLYQMGLVLLMTLPAVRSMDGKSLGWADYLIGALVLLVIVIETVADQQQWNYQTAKQKARAAGGEIEDKYRKGFVQTGLWRYSRHPNFAAEQAVWIIFYFFSVAATGHWLNWSVMGAILLVLLFWGSSAFTESITAGKYPDYADYQKRVPRFLPFRSTREQRS